MLFFFVFGIMSTTFFKDIPIHLPLYKRGNDKIKNRERHSGNISFKYDIADFLICINHKTDAATGEKKFNSSFIKDN